MRIGLISLCLDVVVRSAGARVNGLTSPLLMGHESSHAIYPDKWLSVIQAAEQA